MHKIFRYISNINFFIIISLVAICLVSFVWRINYIEKTPKYNNFGHIYIISTINTWQFEGALKHKFTPVLTYTHKADKNIYQYKRLLSKEGNNYFVSYPPFAFILAYAIASAFKFIELNYLLSYLSILWHFLTAIFIFLIIKKIIKPKTFIEYIPAIFGFSLVIFFQSFLLHSLSWFPELCILPIFSLFIYLIISFKNVIQLNKLKSLLIIFVSFLLTYTDWLGILAILCLFFYSLFLRKKNIIKYISILSLIGGGIGIILFLIQYSSVDGFVSLYKAMGIRFVERSGLFSKRLSDQGLNYFNINTWLLMFNNFKYYFAGFGYLSIFFILLAFYFTKFFKNNKNILSLLFYVVILPIMLHFLLFLNSNILHYGSQAKFSILLSIFSALALHSFFIDNIMHKKYLISGIIAGIILSTIVSLSKFEQYFNNYPYNTKFDEIISIIKQNANEDEAIIIKCDDDISFYLPYIEYNTNRSICTADNFDEANKRLKISGQEKAKFFDFVSNTNNNYYEVVLISNNK